MIRKILISFVILYLLVLFESSFLIHFEIFYRVPSLILISIFFLNLFEDPNGLRGIFCALFGGLFWDIFSNELIGFHILILIALAIFIKFTVRKYIRPVIKFGSRFQRP